MSEIRSKSAKKRIEELIESYDRINGDDLESVVELAEKDAEKRHAKEIQRRGNVVYEVLSRNYGDSIALSLGEEIEAVLNNGGQSDE